MSIRIQQALDLKTSKKQNYGATELYLQGIGLVQLYCWTVQDCCPLCWHHWPWSRHQLILNKHKVMCSALYSLRNSCTSTIEEEAQAAWLGTAARRRDQLCDYNLVKLENLSRLSELTSTAKKHIHVETDLVICDNTAKMGRQLGCNWIGLCVAKDLSRSERVQV